MTQKDSPITLVKPEEESMSHRSRRGFLLSLVVPFTVTAAATSCTKAAPSQKIADQFIEAYYIHINVHDASALSSGLAKEKLDKQLQLMAGAGGPEPAGEKPRVTYSLISTKSESAEEATYVYQIDAHVPDVGKRMVFVKLRQEDGKWSVTQFTEDDSPPSS